MESFHRKALALNREAVDLAAGSLSVHFLLLDACGAMPAEPRLSFRPPGLTSLLAHRHGGLSQALRSAASSLVVAPGLVVPTLALTLAVPLLGSPALASSPAAWAAYDARVRAACRAATTLVRAVERGDRLDLPAPSLSVFLLEGRYRQPHLQGQRGLELCVFEQVTGRASVVGADRFYGPGASSPSDSGRRIANP